MTEVALRGLTGTLAGLFQLQLGDAPDLSPRWAANQLAGGRTWWAHLEFTPINIAPTIHGKKIEEKPDLLASRTLAGEL